MAKVIVVGHGDYGTAMQHSLEMLVGQVEGFLFVDFPPGDDLAALERKIDEALARCGEEAVLFACDMAGGSPFRVAAERTAAREGCCTVAGLNVSAMAEMAYNTALPARELADLAVEVACSTIVQFPPKEEG